MNDIMDMKISGSSAMPGGEYRTVSISGSGQGPGQPALREPALLRQRQGPGGRGLRRGDPVQRQQPGHR